jgi:hypothetical protein
MTSVFVSQVFVEHSKVCVCEWMKYYVN